MLEYRSLTFLFAVICITRIATGKGSLHLDLGPNQDNNQINSATEEKVDLKVYYECLCQGCRALHVNFLEHFLRELSPYLNYKSYPYGNARMVQKNGRTVVECQHGEIECYGNKLHACAIDQLNNTNLAETYNSCMMAAHWGGRGSADKDASKCGESMKINAGPIISCAKSQKGEELLEYYGRETALVPKQYVPFVLINGQQYTGSDYEGIKTVVCEAFTNPPPPCSH